MAKGNGQTAQPKNGAGVMGMGGTIRVQLTEESLAHLSGGEQVAIRTDLGMEFYLTLKPGDKDALIEFSPWFNASECRVKIENSVAIDGEFADEFEVILRNRPGRSVGLALNVEQAEKLAGLLQHYAAARKGYEALRVDQSAA